MKRLWMPIAFLVLAALGMAAIAFNFSINRQDWASTDNAELVAPTYAVMTPQAGRIGRWTSRDPGSRVQAGTELGVLQGVTGSVVLRAPHVGRFVGDYAYAGDLVSQGQEVALIADLGRAYVLAYVDEDSAGGIRVGQTADMRFASDPGSLVVGHVERIYPAVASVVWPVPSLSTGQAFSKSAQWVPVKISMPASSSVGRYLGMSASVRIAIGGGGS